jgi:hypothetical protein
MRRKGWRLHLDPGEDAASQFRRRAQWSSVTTSEMGFPPSGGTSPAHSETVPRNDPCPCGSERKFKKCHGRHPWVPLWFRLPRRRRK